MYIYDTYAKIYMQSYYESFIVSIKTKIRDNFWMDVILFLYILHVALNVPTEKISVPVFMAYQK